MCGEETLEPEGADGLHQFRSFESWGDAANSADITLHYFAARIEAMRRVGRGKEGGSVAGMAG